MVKLTAASGTWIRIIQTDGEIVVIDLGNNCYRKVRADAVQVNDKVCNFITRPYGPGIIIDVVEIT